MDEKVMIGVFSLLFDIGNILNCLLKAINPVEYLIGVPTGYVWIDIMWAFTTACLLSSSYCLSVNSAKFLRGYSRFLSPESLELTQNLGNTVIRYGILIPILGLLVFMSLPAAHIAPGYSDFLVEVYLYSVVAFILFQGVILAILLRSAIKEMVPFLILMITP